MAGWRKRPLHRLSGPLLLEYVLGNALHPLKAIALSRSHLKRTQYDPLGSSHGKKKFMFLLLMLTCAGLENPDYRS